MPLDTGLPLDQVDDHPVSEVAVIVLRAGLRKARSPPQRAKASLAAFARGPLRGAERRLGEATDVEQRLLHGDDVLAVGGELGDVVGDAILEPDEALIEQLPGCNGDDALGGGEEGVEGVRGGGALTFAVAGDTEAGVAGDGDAVAAERHLAAGDVPGRLPIWRDPGVPGAVPN